MKKFICVVCPRGCELTVDNDLYTPTVTGNACTRGRDYALSEYTNPVRVLTFNVRVAGGTRPVVSARAARAVRLWYGVPGARLARELGVAAPVRAGQTLFASLLGERIIATASVAKAEKDE